MHNSISSVVQVEVSPIPSKMIIKTEKQLASLSGFRIPLSEITNFKLIEGHFKL